MIYLLTAYGLSIMIVKLLNGAELRSIPVSPCDDYMAGSDGQIYSRTKYAGFGRKERVDWYPLKGHVTRKGYLTVSLCHRNKKVTKSVHRLVCMAFHGIPKPKSLQVRHLDGSKDNNQPNNLKWGTQAENWQDRRAHGNGIEGEKHHAAKLTDFERQSIRWLVSKGIASQRQVARSLRMSQAAIYSVCLTS